MAKGALRGHSTHEEEERVVRPWCQTATSSSRTARGHKGHARIQGIARDEAPSDPPGFSSQQQYSKPGQLLKRAGGST